MTRLHHPGLVLLSKSEPETIFFLTIKCRAFLLIFQSSNSIYKIPSWKHWRSFIHQGTVEAGTAIARAPGNHSALWKWTQQFLAIHAESQDDEVKIKGDFGVPHGKLKTKICCAKNAGPIVIWPILTAFAPWQPLHWALRRGLVCLNLCCSSRPHCDNGPGRDLGSQVVPAKLQDFRARSLQKTGEHRQHRASKEVVAWWRYVPSLSGFTVAWISKVPQLLPYLSSELFRRRWRPRCSL